MQLSLTVLSWPILSLGGLNKALATGLITDIGFGLFLEVGRGAFGWTLFLLHGRVQSPGSRI